MKKIKRQLYFKSLFWFFSAGFFLVSAVMGSLVRHLSPGEVTLSMPIFGHTREGIQELERLGLLEQMTTNQVAQLMDYQWESGKSLAEILRDPDWCRRLGYKKSEFKVTWYLSNPFEVLPPDLQKAIRAHNKPFESVPQVYEWLRATKSPKSWKGAMRAALIETTPTNLWRASRGKRPYTKNGEFLEPVVIDHGSGMLEIRDGHIATDPRVIPTNSEMLLVVKIDGKDRILKVKATDVGGAIKGRHVDLPFRINPATVPLPHTRYPSELRNPSVLILLPTHSPVVQTMANFNPNQKG